MATVIQDARADLPPGSFEPVTFQEAMLEARGTIRRAHNRAVYHVIPVTGAAVDGRPFPEGKASLYKQIATGEFVPFTVAARTMTDKGLNVSVAVEIAKRKFTRILVHHTAAAVVRITVESIHAKHGVTEQQLAEPLYLVLALNNADVVADLAYSVSEKSCSGTTVPVHIMAAALNNEDLSDIAWGRARATAAFEAAVRKGLCRGTQVPGILNPILVAHEQKVRAHSKKLWAGQAAPTWLEVARRAPRARARPSRAAPVQDTSSSDSYASSWDSNASSSSSSARSSSSSPGDSDSNATPKKQGTSKRGSKKSGRKGQDKARVRRG